MLAWSNNIQNSQAFSLTNYFNFGKIGNNVNCDKLIRCRSHPVRNLKNNVKFMLKKNKLDEFRLLVLFSRSLKERRLQKAFLQKDNRTQKREIYYLFKH